MIFVLEKPILWFEDFIGVGYRYYDIYMNVFPIFQDKMHAFRLWKKTIEDWPDDEIKLRFVEMGSSYWFILYRNKEYKENNTGFVKNVPMSENYQRFKAGYERNATIRFGIYKEKKKKRSNQHNNDDDDYNDDENKDEKFELELLKKSKTVYDIEFLKYSDLRTDSIEWECIKRNTPSY